MATIGETVTNDWGDLGNAKYSMTRA